MAKADYDAGHLDLETKLRAVLLNALPPEGLEKVAVDTARNEDGSVQIVATVRAHGRKVSTAVSLPIDTSTQASRATAAVGLRGALLSALTAALFRAARRA